MRAYRLFALQTRSNFSHKLRQTTWMEFLGSLLENVFIPHVTFDMHGGGGYGTHDVSPVPLENIMMKTLLISMPYLWIIQK